MATINELNKWCQDARALLSRLNSVGPAALGRNTDAVSRLLKKMGLDQKLYPGYTEFMNRYIRLAAEAKAASTEVAGKVITEKEGKRRVKAVSEGLRILEQDMELAAGSVDPQATPEVRKRVITATREKPVYDDKRVRIEAAIETLKKLPGTTKQTLALMTLLNGARAFEPDYKKAYEKLSGLSGNLKSGLEAAAKFEREGGGKDFQLVLKAHRQAITDFEVVGGIGNAPRAETERAAIREALARIDGVAESKTKSVSEAQGNILKQRTLDLNIEKQRLQGAQVKVGEYQVELGKLIDQLVQGAPKDVLGPRLKTFNAAQSLASTQQYDTALAAFKDMAADLRKDAASYNGARLEWEAIDLKLTPGLVTLQEVAGAGRTLKDFPVIGTVANQLTSLITTTLRIELVGTRRYAEAVKLVKDERVLENIAAAAKMLLDAKAGKPVKPVFEGKKSQLTAGIDQAGAGLVKAQALLDEALQKLDKLGGHVAPLKGQAAALMLEWQKARAKLNTVPKKSDDPGAPPFDPDALLPELRDIGLRLARAMTALVERARTASTDGSDELESSRSDRANADLEAPFENARLDTKKKLDYLTEFGVPDAHVMLAGDPSFASLKDEYERLVQDAGRGVYAVARMEKLASDAVNKRGHIELNVTQRLQATNSTAAELRKQIVAMRKRQSDQSAFFDKLSDRLDQVVGMSSSSVLTIMPLGEAKMVEIKREIEMLGNVENTKGGDNFATVKSRLGELKTLLEAKDLKEYQPATQARLLTELTDVLPTRLVGLSPKEALDLLTTTIGKPLGEMRTQVDTAKKAYEKLKVDALKLKQELTALDAKVKATAPKLHASLVSRAEAIEKLPARELANGEQQLKTVRVLFANWSDTGKRSRMEGKLAGDELAAELEEATFDASVKVFKKNIQRQAKQVYDSFGTFSNDRNSDLHGLIQKRLDEAVEEGEKRRNFTVAMEKLRVAEAAARAFIENPNKPEAASRKALISSNNGWKSAVSGFIKDVADLQSVIKRECEGDKSFTPESTKKALEALVPLNALFNALTFESTAQMLSVVARDPNETPARRAAKEQALLFVQRYQRLMNDNRLLRVAADNPFQPVATAPLTQALKNLNGALLAS